MDSNGIEITVTRLTGRVDGIEQRVNSHQKYIDENSKPSLENLLTFVIKYEAVEEEREKARLKAEADQNLRHKQNAFKLNIIIAITGIVGLIVAAAGVMATIYYAKHADLVMPNFIGNIQPQQYAYREQMAEMPNNP